MVATWKFLPDLGPDSKADHLANSQNPQFPTQWPRMIADAKASFIVDLLDEWVERQENKGNTLFTNREKSIGAQ